MKKITLIIITLLLLAGCGMTEVEVKEKQAECERLGLDWHYYDDVAPDVYCVEKDTFNDCVRSCERLFHTQADTWGNGSESQSSQANVCLDKCLTY